MAGSNGSPVHRGGQPQAWPAGSEEEARQLEFERWQQQQRLQAAQSRMPGPPAGDPYAQGYTQIAQPHQVAPQQGFDPQLQAPQPGWPQGGQAGYAQAQPEPDYAPQFERYAPAATPRDVIADPFARHAQAAQQPVAFHDPHAPQQGWGPPHDPRGYDAPNAQSYADPRYAAPPQQQAAPHGYPGLPGGEPRADVQSWDLSHYAPGQIPQGYAANPPPGHQQGWPQPQGHTQQGVEPHWQQQPAPAYWPGQAGQPPGGPHTGFEPPFHAQHGSAQAHGFDGQADAHDPGYDGDEAEVAEPERRGPGTMMIVAALVGAIVAGGGLAYGYKMIGGGLRDKGRPPILKADAAPSKTRPQNAGGMQIEHSDKKFLNRLGNEGDTAVPTSLTQVEPTAASGDVEGGAKKVPTITINVNRDNTITPQVVQASPSEQSVPGLIIDSPPPAATAPPVKSVVRMPPPPPPVVRTTQAPAAAAMAEPLDGAGGAQDGAPKAKRIVVQKTRTAAARDDLMAPKGADSDRSALGSAAAAPRRVVAASGGNGFVAVLASKKNRQDAIASFPDLHQKYPDLLGGKTPDVREIDLHDKGGLWYRLVVGPPGSRQAANTLCAQLKERGMKDCWAAPY